jgi:16S rRNA (cytosine1402-N4)-methyltransferase
MERAVPQGIAPAPTPAGNRHPWEGHVPVLAGEVVAMLAPAPGSLQIDATVGGGGHTEQILAATDPDGRLLGLDADGAAIARVRDRLGPRFGERLHLRQANFAELAEVAPAEGFGAVDGCFFDLGLSSYQLADVDRGFGFRAGGPLDMRFDTSRGVPAAELLATLDAAELAALFRRFGEEPFAGRIARAIVEARGSGPVSTAEELAALVERVTPSRAPGRRRIHPATRVFQALRIAVNAELDALAAGLAAALDLLRPGGRLVVLTYHSLEDRIVKRFLRAERRGCVCPPESPVCVCGRTPRVRLLNPKGITPSDEEVAANPRARSARLRTAERLAV